MIHHSLPPTQTIPPAEAGQLAIVAASTALCLAFQGQLQPEDLQGALDRGLGSVGLRPVPPEQIVLVWGLASQLVQHPEACTQLLKP